MRPDDVSGLFTTEIFAYGTIAVWGSVDQTYHRYGFSVKLTPQFHVSCAFTVLID